MYFGSSCGLLAYFCCISSLLFLRCSICFISYSCYWSFLSFRSSCSLISSNSSSFFICYVICWWRSAISFFFCCSSLFCCCHIFMLLRACSVISFILCCYSYLVSRFYYNLLCINYRSSWSNRLNCWLRFFSYCSHCFFYSVIRFIWRFSSGRS